MADEKPRENALQEAVEELLVDPDSPENAKASPPPQTIDAEPSEDGNR